MKSMAPVDLEHLPAEPGVYLFKDAREDILYIGKGKSLRTRVRSYFPGERSPSMKTRELVRRVRRVETIVVGSEAEALILEANLIKEHQPRFNVQLRDDKRYPYVRVTVQERFPRVFVTRRVVNDGSRYFGPYTAVGYMRRALEVIKRVYTVRSCRYDLPEDAPDRPCLDYHIGRCKAPCVGLQTEESYRDMIDAILVVMDGKTERLHRDVERRMKLAAEALDFERAARLRDVLRGLDTLTGEQRVHRVGGGDHDVIGLARDREFAVAVLLKIRDGVLLGRDTQRLTGVGDEDYSSLLSTFSSRYFLGRGTEGVEQLPGEILAPADFSDRKTLAGVLSESAGRRIRLRIPRRGVKRRLIELASANARHTLEDQVTAMVYTTDRADVVLYDLQDRLNLKVVPRLIVCIDVSHIQGSERVGSAVTFRNGKPHRAGYRRMRIKGDWGNDDYRSMAEVATRYLGRESKGEGALPDLLLLDGGKGQLRAVREALEGAGIPKVALAALAKREEEVYLPGQDEPLTLGRGEPSLHLLQRVRDEAHRFAISYNRKLRRRRTIRSRLADIPGIGPARQKALLRRFGSVRSIGVATEREIADTPGFSTTLARRVLTHLSEPAP